jgi:hypothetical protein
MRNRFVKFKQYKIEVIDLSTGIIKGKNISKHEFNDPVTLNKILI